MLGSGSEVNTQLPHAEIPGSPGILRVEWPKTASSTFRGAAKLCQVLGLGLPWPHASVVSWES